MADINDGAPVFPDDGYASLRDYFAAHALSDGLIVAVRNSVTVDAATDIAESYARCAYTIADAMLKARAAE